MRTTPLSDDPLVSVVIHVPADLLTALYARGVSHMALEAYLARNLRSTVLGYFDRCALEILTGSVTGEEPKGIMRALKSESARE